MMTHRLPRFGALGLCAVRLDSDAARGALIGGSIGLAFCDRANEAAIRSVRPSVERQAVQCQQAKQELADATTKEAVDLASRKIELLCGG